MLTAIGWVLLGGSSVGAVFVGVRHHRPARIVPWMLIGACLLALAAGDVCYALGAGTAADIAYAAMFPLAALCLLALTRGAAVLVDRAHLIDLLAGTCAALLIVWVYVLGSAGPLTPTAAADVFGDIVLLGAFGRLIVSSGYNRTAMLLCLGAFGMLFSDAVYPLLPGRPAEFGYVVVYFAWGAAALHPSMRALTASAPSRPAPCAGRWAVLLGVSVATPPTVLLIEAVSGEVTDGIAIGVAGAITLLLTITRLTDSLDQHSQALARERGLREATAALVGAADALAVDQAVRTAVRHLLPRGVPHRLVFAVDDRELVARSLPTAQPGPPRRSWWLPTAGATAGHRDEATLMCPLWWEPAAVARPNGGALVLTGDRDVLTVVRDAVQVLAGQAALALDRIALVETVSRRESDVYVQAVIRNTADVMLVTDERHRIRYASRALTELLGAAPMPLSPLPDLAHPDDRERLRQALSEGSGDGSVFCALRRCDEAQVLVEVAYQDLRANRLVQGFVITIRDLAGGHPGVPPQPMRGQVDDLPGWVNRRSVSGKFRY